MELVEETPGKALVAHRVFLSEIKEGVRAPSNRSCWSSGLCSAAGMSNFAREGPFHRGRPSSPLCGFPPGDPLGVTVDDIGQRFDPVRAISIVRGVLQVQNARRNHNYRQAWS